jgi:phosphoglycerate kinase
MKTLRDFHFANKRVLLRIALDVPISESGEILDTFRIERTLPTINYLLEHGAKVILISKRGHKEPLSLKPLIPILERFLARPLTFASDCIGPKIKEQTLAMKSGEILLLENVRFHKEELENNSNFAKSLAENGQIFINDAFADSHREHSSISAITKYLPSAAGLLFEKEVRILSRILTKPWRPLVVIIGGAKLKTKSKVISKFLDFADEVLLGGKIANLLLAAKGYIPGKPLLEKGLISEVEKISLTNTKLHLPVDVIVSPDERGELYVRKTAPGAVRREEMILDIGPETISFFGQIILKAKMIIWSGPLGLFEEKVFERGTREIADRIARNHKAFRIAGGGDTLLALKKFNLREKFDFISTGGGAMLEFLAGKELPGIKALEENEDIFPLA